MCIITHSLDVFLRKHFVRLRCKLTHSSCYRFVFDSIFSVGKYFVRMFHAHRICKPNRRTKYLTPVKYRTDVKHIKKEAKNFRLKSFISPNVPACFFSFEVIETFLYRCLHSLSVFPTEILHSCKMHESTTHVNGFVFDFLMKVCKSKPVLIAKKKEKFLTLYTF